MFYGSILSCFLGTFIALMLSSSVSNTSMPQHIHLAQHLLGKGLAFHTFHEIPVPSNHVSDPAHLNVLQHLLGRPHRPHRHPNLYNNCHKDQVNFFNTGQ